MLTIGLTRLPEPTELKGTAIPDPAAIADRLQDAIARIEAEMALRAAEIARLRRVEAAAAAALADLDAFIDGQAEKRKYG